MKEVTTADTTATTITIPKNKLKTAAENTAAVFSTVCWTAGGSNETLEAF